MNRKAVLPNVERMLLSAVEKRVAGRKRARRRGPGFAIIAFAALAVGGSALAATGVWNPLGGDQAHPQSATRQVERPRAAPLRGAPIDGADSGGARHGLSGNEGGAVPPNVGPPVAAPIAGQEPPTSSGSSPTPGGATGSAIGAGPSKGGGQPVRPGGPGNGGTGGGGTGGGGTGAPGPTDLSLACGGFTEGGGPGRPPFGTCRATVSGAAEAPTGAVSFQLSGGGQLSAPSCALADDGNGTSSCATNVTLSASGIFETLTATYGGDAANAASSASESVPR